MSEPVQETLERMTQGQLDAMAELHARFLEGRLGGRRATLKSADMAGLAIKGKDMRQSDFTGCDMTGMDLGKSNFAESRLYACDLSDANLASSNFSRCDLRGTRIENANLTEANLDKADLRVGGFSQQGRYDTGESVSFRGANLSGARLVGSMANAADFSNAIMTGVNIVGADFRNAELKGADLSGAQLTGVKLKGAHLEDAILTGVNMADISTMEVDISKAITDDNVGKSVSALEEPLPKLVETHLAWVGSAGKNGKQLDLSGYDLRPLETLKQQALTAIRAVKARFFGMNLYKTQLQSAVLDESDFRRCDMDEVDMRGTSLKGALFSHAKVRKGNFEPLMFGSGPDGAKRFSPCDFSGASLSYADFSGSKMRMVNFRGADLTNTNLSGADLREADFTDAIMMNTILEGANTEGATIPVKPGSTFKMRSE